MIDSRQAVTGYLTAKARTITDRAEEEIRSRATWEKAKARRLEEMRDMLGLLPWPKRTPLNARITGRIDQGTYVIEKIVFESMPKFYVTGNLYLPKNGGKPAPGVIYVCGHAGPAQGAKVAYQRHGISFAKNGYVAFIIDPIQIAEVFSLHHGVHSEEMYDWYSRGYTPAGPETWNAMRAIDYLETRPEVDPKRIGITGRSGGAAMSWFTGAVDPRVKVVSPIMGISTYAANVREDTQRLHCDCMFPINSWMHDMMHQGALIAPRPLLFGEGKQDALFPVAGYTEFHDRVGKLYGDYGKSEDFRLLEVDTKHQDSDFLREEVLKWFDRFLMDVPERKLDMSYQNLPAESLAALPGGEPRDARNARVHEWFTAGTPPVRYSSARAWERRKIALAAELREKVFRALPAAPRNARMDKTAAVNEWTIASDDTVPVRALWRKIRVQSGSQPAVLYIASDGDDVVAINQTISGLKTPDNFSRLVVWPRGVGEIPWNKTFWKSTMRNAMHVGETVDSMRLADVLAAVDVLARQDGVDAKRITVLGKGVSGALGLYAAILDPRIEHVVLIDPPSTHAEGPIFLNVLRYTDLPEAASLVAPRRITFYARFPQAYEYTRHIYALLGKAENFGEAMRIRWQ